MTGINKTQTSQPTQAAQNQQESEQPKQADTNAVESFRDAMQNNKRKQSNQSDGKGEREKQDTQPQQTGQQMPSMGGDAILRGLQGSTVKSQQPEQPAKLQDITQAIADRILVSTDDTSGKQEVRITLKEDVLPGTEIRLVKENGQLQVSLHSTNNDSYNFLSQHQQGLQNQLSQRLSDKVIVDVQFETPNDPSGQDGRSRQQRNMYDEMEDE